MIQYQPFSLTFEGAEPTGTQSVIDLTATFTCQSETKEVYGFYAGGGRYIIRYLPQQTGPVRWTVSGIFSGEGEEECLPYGDGAYHGLVQPVGTTLQYEDGTAFRSFGTTVYAMMHQSQELIAQTVESILASPFNKIRTCLFPKHYVFNENEPERFAFEKKAHGGFDYHRPCFAFWDAFEQTLQIFCKHQVEVDLILFHPYDHWGFAQMTKEEYLPYLNYMLARFAAYPNVWWSLANEYDSLSAFSKEDWNAIEGLITEKDVYGHMMSCHPMLELYDYARPRVTHCSVQGDVTEVDALMERFHKPVLMDEFGYEGNIIYHWGHLSGFEMVHRFWTCCVMGGYGTHGETFMNPTDTLWWGKGGTLVGSAPARIAFLKQIIEELPGALEPVPYFILAEEKLEAMREGRYQEEQTDLTHALLKLPPQEAGRLLKNLTKDTRIYTGHCGEEAYLAYYGRHCTAVGDMELPNQGEYRIDVIDIWEMTRETVQTGAHGKVEFALPGKEGVAVLAVRQ